MSIKERAKSNPDPSAEGPSAFTDEGKIATAESALLQNEANTVGSGAGESEEAGSGVPGDDYVDSSSDMEDCAEPAEEHQAQISHTRNCSESSQECGRKKVYASEEHNRKERIRRKELKNAVDELRKQLRKPTKKAATISVLKAAQEEIKDLTAIKHKEEKKLEEMRQRHGYLRLKLDRLKMEAQEKSSTVASLSGPPLSQLALQPPPSGQPYSIMCRPPVIGLPPRAPLPPPQPMAFVVGGGLHPGSLIPPLPPSLVSISPSAYRRHTPCPTLITPPLPPLQPVPRLSESVSVHGHPPLFPPQVIREPCIFTPRLPISLLHPPPPVGVPRLVGPTHMALGNTSPSTGVVAGINSWTDDPANQKPYFPVTVFSQSPSKKHRTTDIVSPPSLRPSSTSLLSHRRPKPPPLTLSTEASPHHAQVASSFVEVPRSCSSEELSPKLSPELSPGSGRKRSRDGTAHIVSVISPVKQNVVTPSQPPESDREQHEGVSQDNDGHIVMQEPHVKTSAANDEDETSASDDFEYVYGLQKRAKRDMSSSSSDSDSGGSCFSDQGVRATGTSTRRNLRMRALESHNKNSRKNGGSSRNDGRRVPLLCTVEECSRVRNTEASEQDKDPATSCSKQESRGNGEDLRATERNFLVSLTSNYHVDTGPPPLAIASRQQQTTAPCNKRRQSDGGGDRGWMDEIVEKSVSRFQSKFIELSSTAPARLVS